MRAYHVTSHPDSTGRTVTIRRKSAVVGIWLVMTWCAVVVWPLLVWHGFWGGFAEGAWLAFGAAIGWASHRLHKLNQQG